MNRLYYQDVLKDGEVEVPDNYFSHDAKSIVDTLFDNKLLHPDLTRDDVNALQALIEITMKFRLRSELSTRKLLDSLSPKTKEIMQEK